MNGKVARLLSALAVELAGMPDNAIWRIHDTINDKKGKDGYDFDFVGQVNRYRSCVVGETQYKKIKPVRLVSVGRRKDKETS